MDVSKNTAWAPKMDGFIMDYKNGWFGGTPIFGNTHMKGVKFVWKKDMCVRQYDMKYHHFIQL